MPRPYPATPSVAHRCEAMPRPRQISDAFDNRLEMVLQAYNLTDTPNRSFWGEPNLPGYLQSFGREYSLGVSYSF